MNIGRQIETWYRQNGRDLPWRNTRNPYRIWIAEVVLQQTRIAQGTAYYLRFVNRFPDVASLAAASRDEVLKYWEGLGYYSRARNLHDTAIYIVEKLAGEFPNHYSELMKLKGIGPYTARAIGSFAFGNRSGVVDGNVLRVMSRVLNDFSPVNRQSTKKEFQPIIDQWIKDADPAAFNHGIMDIGATICTPTKPGCLLCPLESVCKARLEGTIPLLPVKDKKKARPLRYFNFYLIWNEQGELAIRKRPESGIWGGLWEIPNVEISDEEWKQKKAVNTAEFVGKLKHVFTHFDMMIHVFRIDAGQFSFSPDIQFIPTEKISIFAFARAVLKIFEKWLPD